MLNFDYNHLCFFAGVLQDEMYHQNEFYGSLTLQSENHHPLHKMLNFDYNHLCFFAGVLQDEIYHQNEFYGSLTLQTENHRGVMISAVLPKSYPPT